MTELNLLNYYNMTLADIHKLKYIEPVEEVNAKAVVKKDKKGRSFFSGAAVIFGIMILSLVAAAVYLVNPFEKKDVANSQLNLGNVEPVVVSQPADISTEPVLIAEPTETTEEAIEPATKYVQIQVFDFDPSTADSTSPSKIDTTTIDAIATKPADTKASNVAINTVTVPIDEPVTKDAKNDIKTTKPITTVKTKDIAVATKSSAIKSTTAKPVGKTYRIEINGVNADEYTNLRNLAIGAKADITILKDLSTTTKVWTVYKPEKNTKVFINNVEVRPIKDFEFKDDAIIYAAEISDGDMFIKLTEIRNTNYDIVICCTDLETAKNTAYKSGITDKVFQIIRE